MSLFGSGGDTITTTFRAKDEMTPVVRGIRASMDRFKKDASTGFGLASGISVFNLAQQGLGTVVDIAGDAIKMASDLAETQSLVNVVFGEGAKQLEEWSDQAAESMGMSKRAALDAAGQFGNLFDAIGLADQAGLEMSRNLTELAADLASFKNTSADEALRALQSALVGETEPMRRYGVVLNAAAVQAYALSRGLARTKAEITEGVKVQARYGLILENTENAQGDFARTSDGLAGTVKTLNAELEDVQTELGEKLLPIWLEFATKMKEDVVPVLETMVDNFEQMWVVQDLLAKGIGGPLLLLPDVIREVQKSLKELRGESLTTDQGGSSSWGFEEAAVEVESAADSILADIRRVLGLVGEAPKAFGALDAVPISIKRDLSPIAGIVKGTLQAAIRQAERDMAALTWALTHPMKDAKLRRVYKQELDDAYKALHKAQKHGYVLAIAAAEQLIRDLTAKMQQLDQARFTMTVGLAYETTERGVREFAQGGYTTTHGGGGNGGGGGGGGSPYHPRGGGGDSGRVLRSGRSSGRDSGRQINVHVDGQRLFRIMDARNGRAIAMGG